MDENLNFEKLLQDDVYDVSLAPLLYDRLYATPVWTTLTEALKAELTSEAARAAVTEARQHEETAAVIETLALAGVRPVVFKGTALAYTIYRKPELRRRCDTDLFIKVSDRDSVSKIMKTLGYERVISASGDLISYQVSFQKIDSAGVEFCFDFHWRLSNPQIFSKLLTYDELRRDALPAPKLSLHALAPSEAHSLMIACIHRVAHHHDIENALWLYDIFLLCRDKAPQWFEQFAQAACAKKIGAICARGLKLTQVYFGLELPGFLVPALEAGGEDELSSLYLGENHEWYRELWRDFKAIDGRRDKVRFLVQHILPPGEFVLHKYGYSDRRALPLLYARRAAGGLKKLLVARPAFLTGADKE